MASRLRATVIVMVCLLHLPAEARQGATEVVWMPVSPIVPALRADPLDPRLSVDKPLANTNIEARVGGVWDVVHIHLARPVAGASVVGFGASGMADLLLDLRFLHRKSLLEFPFLLRRHTRFDLWSGDYSFGLHAAALQDFGGLEIRHRLQIVHLSAHLGDDRFDAERSEWIDGRAPVYFSRNYWQLLTHLGAGPTRAYLQTSFITFQSKLEEPQPRWFWNAGMEHSVAVMEPVRLFAAFDTRTFGRPGPFGLSAKAGFEIHTPAGRGVSVHASWYRGPDWRGQFYRVHASRVSVGFTLSVH